MGAVAVVLIWGTEENDLQVWWWLDGYQTTAMSLSVTT